MKPPSKVQVGAISFAIEQVAELSAAAGAYGTASMDSCIIRIDDQLSPDKCAETILHELTHAMFSIAGLGLDEEPEERMVRSFAPLLLDTLRRNPRLVAFLTDRKES